MNYLKPLTVACLSALFLIACGGGGSSGGSTDDASNGDDDNPIVDPVQTDLVVDAFAINDTVKLSGFGNNTVSVTSQPSYGKAEVVNGVIVYTYQGVNDNDSCESFMSNSADTFNYSVTDAEANVTSYVATIKLQYDALLPYAWHLCNTSQSTLTNRALNAISGNDLNIFGVWSQGISGKDTNTFVIDTGFDVDHKDLSNRVESLVEVSTASDKTHGTAVIGIIAAEANSVGGRGVAYNTNLYLHRGLSSISQSLNSIIGEKANLSDEVSALNLSLGSFVPYATQYFSTSGQFENVYNANVLPIVASGNYYNESSITSMYSTENIASLYVSYDCLANTVDCFFANNSSFSRNHNAIVVAAGNADGTHSRYSSTGSNIWITAFGGEGFPTSHQILSTDVSGCSLGYSLTSSGAGDFENGSSTLNSNCDYTVRMNGTSAATPMITGVVTDLVSLDNDLSIEQIRYILAKTANTNHEVANVLTDSKNDWQTNGAGISFANDYGFGWVDATKAIDYVNNNCSSDANCRLRANEPDYSNVLSTSCSIVDGNGAYNYSCKAIVPSSVQVENVLLDIEQAKFVASSNNTACEIMGTMLGMPSRLNIDSGAKATSQQTEAATVLRNMVISVNSSLTDNKYLVKSKYQNFFGISADPLISSGRQTSYLNVNALYQENLTAGDSISINFSSACPMSFSSGVNVKLIGYAQ